MNFFLNKCEQELANTTNQFGGKLISVHVGTLEELISDLIIRID